MFTILIVSLLCVNAALAKPPPIPLVKMSMAHNLMPTPALSLNSDLMLDTLNYVVPAEILPDNLPAEWESPKSMNQEIFEYLIAKRTEQNRFVCAEMKIPCDRNGIPIDQTKYLCSCTAFGCRCAAVDNAIEQKPQPGSDRENGGVSAPPPPVQWNSYSPNLSTQMTTVMPVTNIDTTEVTGVARTVRPELKTNTAGLVKTATSKMKTKTTKMAKIAGPELKNKTAGVVKTAGPIMRTKTSEAKPMKTKDY